MGMYSMKRWLQVICCLSFVFTQSVFADHPSVSERNQLLLVGTISSNPQKAVKRTQAFADYLASQLSSQRIMEAKVVVAKDIEQMASWLKTGQVDLVSETVFAAAQLIDDANAKPIARRWKSGVGEYSSVFFTSTQSGIKDFSDLVGQTVVFEDRGSTSAFLVPASLLLEHGYQLQELSSPREKPLQGNIGYFFSDDFSNSGGEKNMMAWVHRGLVASAAFSNLDWEKEIPDAIKSDMRVFYQSQSIPRSLMLVSDHLSDDLVAQLAQVLFTAHQVPEGQAVLKSYKKTKQFDPVSEEIVAAIDRAREQKQRLAQFLMR